KLLDIVILLAVLGFPAVMLIGWFHGEKGRQGVSRTEIWLITTLLLLAAVGTYRITAAEESPAVTTDASSAPAGGADGVRQVGQGGNVDLGLGSVAILPFTNHIADAALSWLGPGLADMLTTNFAQRPDLRVVGRQRLYDLMTEAGREETDEIPDNLALSIASSAGARLAVRGSIAGSASDLAIDAQLIELQDGTVIGGERVRGSDVFDLVDTLSARLMGRMDSQTQEQSPAPMLTTRNLEAFQHFYEGVQAERENDPARARRSFEVAVERDSTFSLAWFRLASMTTDEETKEAYMENALRKVKRGPDLDPSSEDFAAQLDSIVKAAGRLRMAGEASGALSSIRVLVEPDSAQARSRAPTEGD
ncbi:MAG: hypothetical protein ABFS14_06760, partial [Gemmatimonadota bacterium]